MVHKVLDVLNDCSMTIGYQTDTTIAEKKSMLIALQR